MMNAKRILGKLKNHTPAILDNEKFGKYAVLIPLVEKEDGIHLLFEVRSEKLRRQPGDICFPGGKIDAKDKTKQDAAIRETTEEIGISNHDITEIHPVDYFVSPFGMVIYPYAGFITKMDNIKLSEEEVAEIFTVPLAFFLETKPDVHQVSLRVEPAADFPMELIPGGEEYDWRPLKMDEYFYLYEDKVIWGLTAKIISHFIEVIQK